MSHTYRARPFNIMRLGQSYLAFEVTSRLRRQGKIKILHINEDQSAQTIQMPEISSDFIIQGAFINLHNPQMLTLSRI